MKVPARSARANGPGPLVLNGPGTCPQALLRTPPSPRRGAGEKPQSWQEKAEVDAPADPAPQGQMLPSLPAGSERPGGDVKRTPSELEEALEQTR